MAPFNRRDSLKMPALATSGMLATPRLDANSTGYSPTSVSTDTPVRLALNKNPYGPARSVLAAVPATRSAPHTTGRFPVIVA
jgi:histidinol-phosphate/aromatic aminotransferase/cobyric acid decarboxylase-like protein